MAVLRGEERGEACAPWSPGKRLPSAGLGLWHDRDQNICCHRPSLQCRGCFRALTLGACPEEAEGTWSNHKHQN